MEKTSLTKLNGDYNEIADDFEDNKNEIVFTEAEVKPIKHLIYGIKDTPPIHITIICGLQVCRICDCD